MQYRSFLRSLVASMTVASLVACGGGVTPSDSPSSDMSLARSGAGTSNVLVDVVINWSSKSSKEARGARFTSPSARSVRIDVSPRTSPSSNAATEVVNKPAGVATSRDRFEAPAGDDVFAFTVFDQQNAGGNALGGARVVRTIRSGQKNIVRATFTGYVASFSIVPDDVRMAPVYENASQILPLYQIAGQAPLTFSVSVEDADGNVILAPVPNVKAFSDFSYIFRVRPVSGHQNTFTIQAVGPIGVSNDPYLVLEAPGANGVTATANYPLVETPLIYLAANSASSGHIYSVDALSTNFPLPGGCPGLSQPVGLAIDNTNDRLYVADAGASKILAYDFNCNAISGWTAPSVPGINAIALSTNTGYIYATTSAGNGAVEVFNSTGAAVTLPNAFATLHAKPVGVAYETFYHDIGVAEGGTPGYVDVYTDSGLYLSSYSESTTDQGSNPFTPTGIATSVGLSHANARPTFWLSGIDNYVYPGASGSTTPTVAQYVAGKRINRPWLQTGLGGPYATITSAWNGISAPLNAVQVPSDSTIMYVIEESGAMYGFECAIGGCPFASTFPSAIAPGPPNPGPDFTGTKTVAGFAGTIQPPGVTQITAAVFGQY